MRRLAAAAFVTALIGAVVAAAPQIAGDRLLDHIRFLASDDLKGRANGTPELDRAAEYVKEQFRSAGLQPGWTDEWTQPFQLVAGLSIGPGNELRIEAADYRGSVAIQHLRSHQFFYSFSIIVKEHFDGHIAQARDRGASLPGQSRIRTPALWHPAPSNALFRDLAQHHRRSLLRCFG